MGRKTPEKKITGQEGEGAPEKREESDQHWEGEADGVWHTPHAIIME